MIAWLLSLLPGWTTGRLARRAELEVRGWTKNNPTMRNLRYGWFRRLLIGAGNRPVQFTLLIAATAMGAAYLAAWKRQAIWFLPSPGVDQKFDAAAYSGVPWSVQATLVALVYPIVLAFIALMLQRRAHSTVSLRVYVLDSAIAPAGASSIGLLLALGLEYFAAPYSSAEFLHTYMAQLLVFNGYWFVCNVALTGFFLSQTIRFIQEDEAHYAYTRIAVDVALRSELIAAAKQHMLVNAPYSDWGVPNDFEDRAPRARVRMLALSGGGRGVGRHLRGSMQLDDVHLRLLKRVACRWIARANAADDGTGDAPLLVFPQMVGEVATGRVELCWIEHGPPLTRLERLLVRSAFRYRSSRRGTLSLSTKKMLAELGAQVQATAEDRRFGAAEDGLRTVLQLHKTLLLASAADSEGVFENAATMYTSEYRWGSTSFDMEWLKPYREIGRIAVNALDEDARLFRTLAAITASIAADLPAKPEKLVIDAQHVSTNLMYQLASWWTRRADASLAPGEKAFSGKLPAPLDKVYEEALVALIGGWGHLHIDVKESTPEHDATAWDALAARAKVYAAHIDNSALMFLKAVSRGDEVASAWLLDSFLKWWGNRQHELPAEGIDSEIVCNVTLSLADKSWQETQAFFWNGGEPIALDLAKRALNLAIRRYWESVRLYLAVLLVHNAGYTPDPDCRELRLAAALAKGRTQHPGGNVAFWPMDTLDAVSSRLLAEEFGINTVGRRLDEFADKLRWEKETPVVSGWIYGWVGGPDDLASMKRSQAVLLVALAFPRAPTIGRNKRLIERWWRDMDKLETVARYCREMRKQVLSGDFRQSQQAITALQRHLGAPGEIRSARRAVSGMFKALGRVAHHERIITLRALDVDEGRVRSLADRTAANVSGPDHPPSAPIVGHQFNAVLDAPVRTMSFQAYKRDFVSGGRNSDFGLAEHLAVHIRGQAEASAFDEALAKTSLQPANAIELRNGHDVTVGAMQDFVIHLASLAADLRAAGEDPVILVGETTVGSLLRPYRWGPDHEWQTPLPSGVVVRGPMHENGEKAHSYVNDTPVYSFQTPRGDCYVVPSRLIRFLEYGGHDPASSISIRWTQANDEQLNFTLTYRARFVGESLHH